MIAPPSVAIHADGMYYIGVLKDKPVVVPLGYQVAKLPLVGRAAALMALVAS
jgi:hypothetical protein